MTHPMQGKRRFQWSTGAWFGGQVGGTCWLALLAGVILNRGNATLAAALAGLFFLANVVGTLMWMRRDRIAPFKAVMCLIGLLGAVAQVAIILLVRAYPEEPVGPLPWLIVPGTAALMFQMYMIEYASGMPSSMEQAQKKPAVAELPDQDAANENNAEAEKAEQ